MKAYLREIGVPLNLSLIASLELVKRGRSIVRARAKRGLPITKGELEPPRGWERRPVRRRRVVRRKRQVSKT